MATSFINIPKQFIDGIKHLSLITEEEMTHVYELLHQIPKGVSRTEYFKIFDEDKEFPISKEIGSAIFSFGGLLRNYDSAEDISNGLVRSFKKEQQDNISNENLEKLRERLKGVLLLLDNIKPIFQIFEQLSEENTAIRIDINPATQLIFDDNINTQFAFAFYKLKITYRVKEKKKTSVDWYALDDNDLRELKKKIDEAIEKQEKIKTFNQGQIKFIEND